MDMLWLRSERIMLQQQAKLEREIAVEELRLQRLRLREEAARLEKSHAKDTSTNRAKRSDEAARRHRRYWHRGDLALGGYGYC